MMDKDALARKAAELETADAADIIRWASGQFGSKLTFATSLGIEDCVVTDMIARQALPVAFFTLDTGLLFPETYALKAEVEKKYGIQILAVKPQFTVEEQAERSGAELWLRDPDQCCELRKMQPLRSTLGQVRRMDYRHPARPDARTRECAGRELGWPVRPGEGEPARAVDVRGRAGVRPRARRSVQSAARSELSEHRLRAVHEPGPAR